MQILYFNYQRMSGKFLGRIIRPKNQSRDPAVEDISPCTL